MNRIRKLLFTSLAVLFLTTFLGLLINLLTGSPEVSEWLKQNSIGTRELLISIIVLAVVLLFVAYLQFRYDKGTAAEANKNSDMQSDDDEALFLKSLSERYDSRYAQKMDDRFEVALEVVALSSGAADVVTTAYQTILDNFRREGRLLVVGDAGSGKSVLLLRLARALIDDNIDKETPLFPVVFNLSTWKEEYVDIEEWLIALLHDGEGLSLTFAKKLLEEQRIIFLFDGLDELARDKDSPSATRTRSKCLKAMNQYFRGRRKGVICCRYEEYSLIVRLENQAAPVASSFRLLGLSRAEVLLALQHAETDSESAHHASARYLLKLINEHDHTLLLDVMRTPFYFTVALEVFDFEISNSLPLPNEEAALKTFLVEKLIDGKLGGLPGKKTKFPKLPARRWLVWLAKTLERKQQVSFELASLQRTELRYKWLFNVVFGLTIYLLASFFLILLVGGIILPTRKFTGFNDFVLESIILILGILFLGLLLWFPAAMFFAYRTKKIIALDSGRMSFIPLLQIKTWIDIFFASFLYSFSISLMLTFLVYIYPAGALPNKVRPPELDRSETYLAIFFMCFMILSIVIFYERLSSHLRVPRAFGGAEHSYQRLRRGIFYNFLRLNIAFALMMLTINLGVFRQLEPITHFNAQLVALPVITLIAVVDTTLFKHFLLRVCLVLQDSCPLRLASFLDYAAGLRLLEKDGGQWRFRHQTLQRYLANMKM